MLSPGSVFGLCRLRQHHTCNPGKGEAAMLASSAICEARGVKIPLCCALQGSGKDLIQPVLDNQLKAASPLVLPPEVHHLIPFKLPQSHLP